MQLVLSGNRIIAHGENFIAMGGVVINYETGVRYDNATIAECNGCPSDIDKVGYEYHAGKFVPCAPFGKGNNNGYFMEVCESCATPRNSGVPIKDFLFCPLGSVIASCSFGSVGVVGVGENLEIPVSKEVLAEYKSLRYVIKKGSFIDFSNVAKQNISHSEIKMYVNSCSNEYAAIRLLKLSAFSNYFTGSGVTNDGVFTFSEDYITQSVINVVEEEGFTLSSDGVTHTKDIYGYAKNALVWPRSITVHCNGYSDEDYPVSAEFVIELQGRKV